MCCVTLQRNPFHPGHSSSSHFSISRTATKYKAAKTQTNTANRPKISAARRRIVIRLKTAPHADYPCLLIEIRSDESNWRCPCFLVFIMTCLIVLRGSPLPIHISPFSLGPRECCQRV